MTKGKRRLPKLPDAKPQEVKIEAEKPALYVRGGAWGHLCNRSRAYEVLWEKECPVCGARIR
jgi:hypothetical protein